jgi:hypothetical protein
MSIIFKSKWFFIFLFVIALFLITIFYKTEDKTIDNKAYTPNIKQEISSNKAISISEIKSDRLPPESKTVFDSLVKLHDENAISANPELEDKIKETDALVAKTDNLLALQGIKAGMPIFEKELSEKSKVENQIVELQNQLNSLRKTD